MWDVVQCSRSLPSFNLFLAPPPPPLGTSRFLSMSGRKMEPASGQLGQLEKAITVYGQPENCTAACRRILEVMTEEAKNVGKDQEICLKILAHNKLIGRIIGKQGATIKKIMEVIKN